MKPSSLIGLIVGVFAVSLPGMYFLNTGKSLDWIGKQEVVSNTEQDDDDPAVDVLCLKGMMHAGEGQHEKAIAAFDEAIKRSPKYSFSYVGRGDVYLAKGDMDRALADYQTAARLDPDNDAAKERLEAVRKHKGQR